MILQPLSEGSLNGSGSFFVKTRIVGGIVITADGTNDATVTIRRNDANGTPVFKIVTKSPAFIIAPIFCNTQNIYVTCSGTGAGVFLYEWVN